MLAALRFQEMILADWSKGESHKVGTVAIDPVAIAIWKGILEWELSFKKCNDPEGYV